MKSIIQTEWPAYRRIICYLVKSSHIVREHAVQGKETEPVSIYCKDRSSSVNAVVIPGSKKVLLGAIPLEAMGLMVNPVSQELVGIFGDKDVILAL